MKKKLIIKKKNKALALSSLYKIEQQCNSTHSCQHKPFLFVLTWMCTIRRGTYVLLPRTQIMIHLISHHAVENIHNSLIIHWDANINVYGFISFLTALNVQGEWIDLLVTVENFNLAVIYRTSFTGRRYQGQSDVRILHQKALTFSHYERDI